jgi:signal peptidase
MSAIAERPASDSAANDVAEPGRAEVPAARGRGAVQMWHVLRAVAGTLGTLLVVAAALVLVAMTIGPRLFQYRTATMLTGSMVPAINPGDVIVDVREGAADLRVGQIVTYQIPVDDHRVESHRVVWARHLRGGAVLFRTRGDANNGADPWTARAGANEDIWRVATVVPLAGDAIRVMRRPQVQLALTRVLPVLLIGSALISIWRRPSRPVQARDEPDEAPTP